MRIVSRISSHAQVTEDFMQKVSRLAHTLIFKSPAFKGGKKFLSIFRVTDPQDPEDSGYFYSERLGRDSVAFLLYDKNAPDKPYIALSQFHSPQGRFVKGAFTGSLDKNLTPEQTTVEEIEEEAGYTVTEAQLTKVGEQPVGANTNETVHLFVGDVTNIVRKEKNPENCWELNTHLIKMSKDEIFRFCEWKGQLTMLHFEAQNL